MAIIKHIAMKSGNYTGAIHYLLFQHDEFTEEVVVDEYGAPVLRKEFFSDGINCEPYAFDYECSDLNRKFHKNCGREEIKQHHYIISFDPKDVTERGLTGERAQALGMEYAKENFPGHQMIVATAKPSPLGGTHADGHNRSGNIHVHIVLNSLRKNDVDKRPFMEREIDSKAGYKHHVTPKLLMHLKQSLMNLCNREQLHQVDLLRRPKKRITEREYYANRRAKENAGNKGTTKFESQKDYLRRAIEDCAAKSENENAFRTNLKKEYGIALTVSRGRYGYIHPDRNKPIRGRMLGTDYEEKHLREVFARYTKNRNYHQTEIINRKHIANNHGIPPAEEIKDRHNLQLRATSSEEQTNKNSIEKEKPRTTGSSITTNFVQPLPPITTKESKLRLVTNLQSCVKAQANYYYARKVRISNLQKMAETVTVF